MSDGFDKFFTGIAIALAAVGVWLYLVTVF
jgi:hypothetical protein